MAGEVGTACGEEELEALTTNSRKDQRSEAEETEARGVAQPIVVGCQVEAGCPAEEEEARALAVQLGKFSSQYISHSSAPFGPLTGLQTSGSTER